MNLSLVDKVAVVTGASTGLGRGIAVAFARSGAKVVVGDLNEHPPAGSFDDDPGLTTAELITQAGGEAAFQACDVTQRSSVIDLVGSAIQRFGGLNVMVNNAGVYRGGGRLHELSEDDLDACLNVLVKGSWLGSQEAVKVFLATGGGSIINIVSTAGLRAHVNQSPYNMAKAAQANLTRCLALEYGADNIRANAICPTYMKTAMSRSGFDSDAFTRMVSHSNPLGRWGEITDVSNLAVFLASDAASFLNGALIPVDGGETTGVPAERSLSEEHLPGGSL